MILGVSHIALGSSDIDRDGEFFSGFGYRGVFCERNLPLQPAERALIARSSTGQNIAYFQRENALSLELINYGELAAPSHSPFQLVFPMALRPQSSVPPDRFLAAAWRQSGRGELLASRVDDLATTLYWSEKSSGSVVLMPVADVAAETRRFQDGFRGSIAEQGEGWARCSFRGLMPQWNLDLMLVEAETSTAAVCLDGSGFVCLSFLTSDLEQDKPALLDAGLQTTSGVFDLNLNGKNVAIEILRLPGGALIELMQVTRETRG